MTNVKVLLIGLSDYLEQSSIHGLRYLSEGRNFLEKFIWFTLIVVSLCFAGHLIKTTIEENEAEPVLTTIETATIEDVPFPAITIGSDERYKRTDILIICTFDDKNTLNTYLSELILGDLWKPFSTSWHSTIQPTRKCMISP